MTEPIDDSGLALATLAAQVADAEHGSDIMVLEVGEVLGVTEYFVIVSASNRAAGAQPGRRDRGPDPGADRPLAAAQRGRARAAVGAGRLRRRGGARVPAEVREFYEIERLYTDVPKVDWSEADSPEPAKPGRDRCDRRAPVGIVARPLGAIAQLVERFHGMEEVKGSIPFSSTPKPLFSRGFAHAWGRLKEGVEGLWRAGTPQIRRVQGRWSFYSDRPRGRRESAPTVVDS